MLAGTKVMAQTGVSMYIDEELSGNTIWVYSSFDTENDPIRVKRGQGFSKRCSNTVPFAIAGPHV